MPGSDSEGERSNHSLKGRKSPFGNRMKRSTADSHAKPKKKSKPIRSKLALLKKNKRSKRADNFEVEIKVGKTQRVREQEMVKVK